MANKILFLGYDKERTPLINAISDWGSDVEQTSGPIDSLSDWDRVISFGYTHILKKGVIRSSKNPIINLHISYLPFNKGFFPNFWAHYEKTPSGVTIHEINEGIDTGPIIFQKKVSFDKEITFSQTYEKLIREIEHLFIENLDSLLTGDYLASPQVGDGTFRYKRELPPEIRDWDENIENALRRVSKGLEARKKRLAKLVDVEIKTNHSTSVESLKKLLNENYREFDLYLRKKETKISPEFKKKLLIEMNR